MPTSPAVRVETGWSLHGIPTVIVENDVLRITLMPSLGGKIWQLTHRGTGRELLWHNARLKPAASVRGATYDDAFVGGLDELFPNDPPETVGGEALPDHGELWTCSFDWALDRADEHAVVVHQWASTVSYPCRTDTWITVYANDPRVTVRRRIVNESRRSLPYLWKLHAAAALSPGARLDLPATSVVTEPLPPETSGPARGGREGRHTYTWPFLPGDDDVVHDMRRTPPVDSGMSEFQYALGLTAGWCAISHPGDGSGLALAFDPEIFPTCWTFASYGGWRGLEVAVLEPGSGWPVSLLEGVAAGTHRVLAGGAVLDTTVVLTAASGVEHGVAAVDRDGTVHPVAA